MKTEKNYWLEVLLVLDRRNVSHHEDSKRRFDCIYKFIIYKCRTLIILKVQYFIFKCSHYLSYIHIVSLLSFVLSLISYKCVLGCFFKIKIYILSSFIILYIIVNHRHRIVLQYFVAMSVDL